MCENVISGQGVRCRYYRGIYHPRESRSQIKMERIPSDVFTSILSYVPLVDIRSLGMCNRSFHERNQFFKEFKRRFKQRLKKMGLAGFHLGSQNDVACFTGSTILSVLHDEAIWPGQDLDVFCTDMYSPLHSMELPEHARYVEGAGSGGDHLRLYVIRKVQLIYHWNTPEAQKKMDVCYLHSPVLDKDEIRDHFDIEACGSYYDEKTLHIAGVQDTMYKVTRRRNATYERVQKYIERGWTFHPTDEWPLFVDPHHYNHE